MIYHIEDLSVLIRRTLENFQKIIPISRQTGLNFFIFSLNLSKSCRQAGLQKLLFAELRPVLDFLLHHLGAKNFESF